MIRTLMKLSTNIVKSMAPWSVVQVLGGVNMATLWFFKILENLLYSNLYLKKTKCMVMIPIKPYTWILKYMPIVSGV